MDSVGSPASLRLLNAQRILDIMLVAGDNGLSRADIARTTGLSKPTVSALVADLQEAGVMRPVSKDRLGAVGRPATPFEVAPNAGFVFAADVSARTITFGISDLQGTIRAERRVDTGPDAEAALRQVATGAAALQTELGCPIDRACVGIPGIYLQAEGVVGEALNIPGLPGMPVARLLEAELGVPVHVDNDVNLAARGDLSTIADDGLTDLITVSIGTGIGSGLILDRRLFRGGSDAAGEIGALVVTHDPETGSPERTLEEVASSPGLERAFRELLDRGVDSTLPRSATASDILTAATAGDPAAEATLDMAADALARVLANAALLLNPDRILLGGEIGATKVYVEAVAEALGRHTTTAVDLLPSSLGQRATFVGATMHAVEALQGSIAGQRLGAR